MAKSAAALQAEILPLIGIGCPGMEPLAHALNGTFTSTWESIYHRADGVAETEIRVNRKGSATIKERVYSLDEVQTSVEAAGLTVLGAFDAETWRPPGKRTIRIDVVAMKNGDGSQSKRFDGVRDEIRGALKR